MVLDTATGGPALKATCGWLTFKSVGSELAVKYGDFMAIVLRAALFASDCDATIVTLNGVKITAAARLWGGMQGQGLAFTTMRSPTELWIAVDAAAAKMDKSMRLVQLADLERGELYPTATGIPAHAELWARLTYSDLLGAERSGRDIAHVVAMTGVGCSITQRDAGTDFALGWQRAIKACLLVLGANGLDKGDVEDEERRMRLGDLARGATMPRMFARFPERMVARRIEFADALVARGQPGASIVYERLPDAVASGEIPMLAALVAEDTTAAAIKMAVDAVSAVLKLPDGAPSEASLRAVDAELVDHRTSVAAGANAAARTALIKAAIALTKSTADAAPSQDKEGAGGALVSHSKLHSAGLEVIYATTNFQGQERALVRMEDPEAYIYLALTAEFLSDTVGDPGGPESEAERKSAEGWFPLAIFHQLAWGKIKNLLGKPALSKLGKARQFMAVLAGKLAIAGFPGIDAPGRERFAGLALTAFTDVLAKPTWRDADTVNGIDIPIQAMFHDIPADAWPAYPKEAVHRDIYQLLRIKRPLAHILRLVGIPLQGPGSVPAWLRPIEDIVTLHGPGLSDEQHARLGDAIQVYISDSLEEYVVSYSLERGEADANVKLASHLGDGNALVQLNQTLRALNQAASRKRTADGDAIGATVCIPQLVFSHAALARGAHSSPRRALPLRALSSAGGGSTVGTMSCASLASISSAASLAVINVGTFQYNRTKVMTWMAANGCGGMCPEGMLAQAAPTAMIEKLVTQSCPAAGTPGHETAGAQHKLSPDLLTKLKAVRATFRP